MVRLWFSIVLMVVCVSARADELMVSAAASLNQAFSEIAKAYQQIHPETQVVLNFAASGLLLQQVAKGAPVDVLAVADQQTMNSAEQQELILPDSRADFAANALVVITPKASAAAFTHLADLQDESVQRIAIGNPDAVPAGRYAKAALEAAGLWQGFEGRLIGVQNVRQALAYAARGEVDAAFVYSSDVGEAADQVQVAFEVALAQPPVYPLATVRSSPRQVEAERFQAFVRGEQGQAILAQHGFIRLVDVK